MMKLKFITFTIAILLLGTNAMCEDSSDKKIAFTRANTWLTHIDNEKYTEGWNNAASILKNTITSLQFEQSISTARQPFGKFISRKLVKQDHYTSLPGAPDGNYYLIQYTSKFKNKAEAIETLTISKNEDGMWNVSGYFIK